MNYYSYLILIFFLYASEQSLYSHYTLGIELLTQKLILQKSGLKEPRIGLITNQTGRTIDGQPTVLFLQRKGITVTTIFAPEHGYWGTVKAGQDVPSTVDTLSGLPVVSLYAHGSGKKITKQQADLVDLFIFDIQDSGMRHYTYVSLLYKVMEAAVTFNKPVIVCDRPNPLGGIMEGPLVEKELHSFISIAAIPLRHGMTLGELALYFNRYHMQNKVNLHIAPLQNYTRKKTTKLLAPLSPNLQTIQSVYGYSFLGLMGEIGPFDVGVGTPATFCRIGLPNEIKQAKSFFTAVKNLFLKKGITATNISYSVSKNKKKYVGLQLHFNPQKDWSTIDLLTMILKEAQKKHITLTFSPMFNKAFGSPYLQNRVKMGNASYLEECVCNQQIKQFYIKAKQFFLYKPFPTLPCVLAL